MRYDPVYTPPLHSHAPATTHPAPAHYDYYGIVNDVLLYAGARDNYPLLTRRRGQE